MEKEWVLRAPEDPEKIRLLVNALGVDEVTATLLIRRGIETFDDARKFFRPDLLEIHDPFLMADMHKAVDRLSTAYFNKEKVLVFGDYDVDGTTAVTIVYSFLSKFGMDCEYYIPDRYTEGYGFSFNAVELAKEKGQTLIITLDCGIRDEKKIVLANEYGIDVIICDHHLPEELPPAFAVLDTKRNDCNYPYKGLSGCGVGFKMLQGFCIQQGIDLSELYGYLDLLTISIGADIVPLTGENRTLAYFGLQELERAKRPGIQALLQQASFKKERLTITDVVFVLAPRINAAGRIFSGKQAVQLMLAETLDEALALSPALEENNNTRKTLDKGITQEALQLVGADSFYNQSFSTVVYSEGWHKGVVGIVASRLVEEFYKPAIVLCQNNGKLSGSARSIPGIDLYEALTQCSDLLDQFGGHTMAAGLALLPDNFELFRTRFDGVIADMLQQVRPHPTLAIDYEVSFDQITPKFFRILKQFEPFGPENMKPVFVSRKVTNARFSRAVGETGSHLKLHVKQLGSSEFDGIAFDFGHLSDEILSGKEFDMVYSVEENVWNGNVTLQLAVKDIKLC